jgi:hypothetical protein
MSINATVSKVCPEGIVFLVPGRIAMSNDPHYSEVPPAEEEIVVDAMLADGIAVATYINPAIKLTLLEPAGCEFLLPNKNLPNFIVWDFPEEPDHTIIRASSNLGDPEELNRGNSKSYRFAIMGRAGREIKLQVLITAQPVSVEVDSCVWTVEGFDLTTINLGVPLDTFL